MVSLCGSKQDKNRSRAENEDAQEGDASDHAGQSQAEPSERTRLLPQQQQQHDAYLDPDDPAVSPYNLWAVRATRYLSIIFLIVTFLWWVLLLVSIFISPPGMHSRGSGFFDFSFTTLTAGNLLVGILFFVTPSKAAQVSCFILAAVLLADMIVVLAVGKLRFEEGWVGIASVVWAAVIAFWTVITDRIVAWGKREEEERLTGREETRRSLREWCSVLTAAVLLIVFIVITVLSTAVLVLRARDASLAPPGERYFVDGDKYQVHIYCEGNVTKDVAGKRNPTILLEAGERPVEDGLAIFAANAVKNGTIDRYCFWDRPGFGWSDNAPSPLSAGMAADALSEALARAGEQGPWILMSAGIGGIYSRIFSSRHAKEVRGIFLIDPLHEDLLYRVGSPGRGFILWARGIISPLGFDRLAGALFKGRNREDRVYGRSTQQGGKYLKAKLQENLVADSLTKNEVVSARRIQGKKTPLVIVSSGIETRRDSEWERKQRDLSHLTKKLVKWDVVNGAPHEVWRTLEGRQTLEDNLGRLVNGI